MVESVGIEVARGDIAAASAVGGTLAAGEGAIVVAVERFALTSNNVTYAAHGEDMGYWKFFPATDPARGVVPVWGFGTVVESRADAVAAGERFYGYWPMASHAVLTPGKVTQRGFVDGAAHRAGLPAVYNGYMRVQPGDVADERVWALFRPLYITSFLLALDMAARPGIARVVLSSASSKTALGMAQAMQLTAGPEIVGLTSAGNTAFVERTGYFDRVLGYADVGSLEGEALTVFVDFSGNGEVRRAVHARLGDGLAASLIVGDTHWAAANGGAALAGPRAEIFFAPTVLAGRLAEWGQAGFDDRLKGAWEAFTASSAGWLEVIEARGVEAALGHWAEMAAGRVDPARGVVLGIGAD